MACKLMKLNYNTGHAVFSIDDNSDLNNLPDLKNTGKSEDAKGYSSMLVRIKTYK